MADPIPRCPTHRLRMDIEDVDHAYGQAVWLCPRYRNGCREVAHTGSSDYEILLRENPR